MRPSCLSTPSSGGAKHLSASSRRRRRNNWRSLPIGERTAAVGHALVGTRYKSFTLEIDDHVEARLGEFQRDGLLDVFRNLARLRPHARRAGGRTGRRRRCCITSSSIVIAAAFAPANIFRACITSRTGSADNDRRGLVNDLTRELGGVRVRPRGPGNDLWLAALSLSQGEPVLARAARPDGGARESSGRFTRSRKTASRGSSRN